MWPFDSSSRVTHTDTGLRIKLEPEDRPKFKRIYSADLPNGRSIKVTMWSSFGSGRYSSGELNQPGNRWILFDPERVADKLIDPALVAMVEARCAEIFKLDREFIQSSPSEYTDTSRNVWKRVS